MYRWSVYKGKLRSAYGYSVAIKHSVTNKVARKREREKKREANNKRVELSSPTSWCVKGSESEAFCSVSLGLDSIVLFFLLFFLPESKNYQERKRWLSL